MNCAISPDPPGNFETIPNGCRSPGGTPRAQVFVKEAAVTEVGICVATRWEWEAVCRALLLARRSPTRRDVSLRASVGAWSICLLKTGIGPARAAATLQDTVRRGAFDYLISTGFACSLTSSRIGDVLIGTEVGAYTTTGDPPSAPLALVPCDAVLGDYSWEVAQQCGIPATRGRFVSVPRVVCQAREKDTYRAASGAVGLDMESAAIGAVARQGGIPFLVVRGVSDLVDEDLPLDFNMVLHPAAHLWDLLASVSRPSTWQGIARLRRQSVVASAVLTKFFGHFFAGDPPTIQGSVSSLGRMS